MRNCLGATALTLMLVASAIGGCGGEDDEASPRSPAGGSAGSSQGAAGESGGGWGELDASAAGAAGAADPGAGGVGGIAGGAAAGSGGVAGEASGGVGGVAGKGGTGGVAGKGGTGGVAGKGGTGGVVGNGGTGGIGDIDGGIPLSVTASFESAKTTACYKGIDSAFSTFSVKFSNPLPFSQQIDLSGKLTLSDSSSAVATAMPIVPSSVTIAGKQTQVVSLKSPLMSVPKACNYCGHKATLSLTYELPNGTKKTTSIGPDKVYCN